MVLASPPPCGLLRWFPDRCARARDAPYSGSRTTASRHARGSAGRPALYVALRPDGRYVMVPLQDSASIAVLDADNLAALGRVELLDPEGWSPLVPGEIVVLPRSPDGGEQAAGRRLTFYVSRRGRSASPRRPRSPTKSRKPTSLRNRIPVAAAAIACLGTGLVVRITDKATTYRSARQSGARSAFCRRTKNVRRRRRRSSAFP